MIRIVANTAGINADAVAELALGLMFALERNIPFGHGRVPTGRWERKSGQQLCSKTLGILDLGNIGKRLCKLAHDIGMRVIASNPLPNTAFAARHGVEPLSLPKLLPKIDYLSLHIFGGTENTALIDAAALAKRKPSACLLNLAQGEGVDHSAYIRPFWKIGSAV